MSRSNDMVVRRVVAEEKLLAGIKNEFLSAANIEKLKRKAHRIFAERAASAGPERRELEAQLAEQERIIANIVHSIASASALKSSSALAARLAVAEAEKARCEEALGRTPAADRRVVEMIPAIVERVHEIVATFEAKVYEVGGPCGRARPRGP
jgi:hypothetical protein